MAPVRGLCVVAALATAGSVGTARADVRIAVAGPITGQYAAFGEQMKRGAELAVRDINAKGGVNGQPALAHHRRRRLRPEAGRGRRQPAHHPGRRVRRRPLLLRQLDPGLADLQRGGRAQISPASNSSKLTEQGLKNVFRTCGRDDVQGVFTAGYIVDNQHAKRVAIVHDQTTFGKGLADEVKRQLNKRGAQEAMYEAISQGDRDFSALITKMKSANIDLVYYGGYHTEAGLLVRQAREQGLAATLMSGSALVDRQFWAITGATGEGTLITFAPDARKQPAAAEAVREFEAQGYAPEGFTLYTYAAVQVFAEAARRAGSTQLERLEQALHGGTYDTVLGPLTFDDKGDVKDFRYCVYKWHDGRYDEFYCPPGPGG